MSHGDRIAKCRRGFRSRVSATRRCGHPDEKRKYYGVMFHEVVHTPSGRHVAQFVRRFRRARRWTMRAFKDEAIERIARRWAGRVICGLSGGVDLCRRGADARGDRQQLPACSSITA